MTLLFDFDGTVAHTLPLLLKIFNSVAPQYDLPQISKNQVPLLRQKSLKQLMAEYKVPVWRAAQLARDVRDRLRSEIATAPVVTDLPLVLKQLHHDGHRLGIVTSNSTEIVNSFLNKHTLSMFEFVYSDTSLFGKHRVITKCLARQHLAKDDTYYVGDEVRDVEATHRVGLPMIAVSWGFNAAEALARAQPTHLIAHPRQLIEILV
jgi:phosphoglycolate phosphatase-like HAD superfamily hydrolase